jgi:hypothetical protein
MPRMFDAIVLWTFATIFELAVAALKRRRKGV